MKYDLTIVVPTYKEQDNIAALYHKISETFYKVKPETQWVIVYVDDDSPDNTLDNIQRLKSKYGNVEYIQRVGRRGLASAISEGIVFASSEYVIVMDADLQHDESKLPEIYELLMSGPSIVVCGRDFEHEIGLSKLRRIGSIVVNWIMNWILPIKIADPLAGYFGVRREFFMLHVRALQKNGFKILFDLLSFAKCDEVIEIKSNFKERVSGESKLNDKIVFDAIELIIKKITRNRIPADFIIFCLVGGFGAVFHLGVLFVCVNFLKLAFIYGQSAATISTIALNYYNNSKITFRNTPSKLTKGSGLFRFLLICGFGAFLNVMSAEYLYKTGIVWWASGLLGAIVGAVWNYVFSKFFIWSDK